MKNTNIIPNWATYGILFIAAFLFVFLFSSTTSPLYEHHPFWFNGDSGIFQEMGICLLQGGTPFIDLFDHKGPILWFIQACGKGLNHNWGLMVIQSIALFFTLVIWYKSTHILVEKQVVSIIITLTGLLFLLAFYVRGNLCEEWSLPFISLPIYLYLKRWKQNTNAIFPLYNHTDAVIIGICVGIIAMIRLNNTAPIVGFVLWHFFLCVHQKKYKHLWIDIALIISGIVIIFIICSSFYLFKAGWDGVYEMFYGTFIFKYIYYLSLYNIHNPTLINILLFYLAPIVFGIINIICLLHKKETIHLGIPVIISYFITIFAVGYSIFYHYLMVFIPLLVLTTSYIFFTKTKFTYILGMAMVLYFFHTGYDAIDHLAFRMMGKKANTEINDGFHRFVSSLPLNERGSIYNEGMSHNIGPGLFANENICQCNRILYKRHLDYSSNLRKYEATHGIKDLKPIWVLTQSPRPEASDDYLAQNYTLADSIPGGEFDPIWCWKKNYEYELTQSNK